MKILEMKYPSSYPNKEEIINYVTLIHLTMAHVNENSK
ncbi:MAG: hypothetical protein HGGPFJEG_02288 [Ignavibacteria bacterium]|nr:hypothetical protein [Ignavibacteria bacterium]